MSELIDTNFDVYSDTPTGKDPDSYSPTLRTYHKILWSKNLPNGSPFNLSNTTSTTCLYHQSELGEFFLSSDGIGVTLSRGKNMQNIVNQFPPDEIDAFFTTCSTIGGYIVFPANKIDNKMTINGARGCHPRIKDRFDLTLECIRLHYANEDNPLGETLNRYSEFFGLFQNFEGYVDFFLLQDLVASNYSSIKFCLPFESFNNPPLPRDVHEYRLYIDKMTDFILARNKRILNYAKDKLQS